MGSRPRRSAVITSVLTVLALGLLAWTIYGNRAELRKVLAHRPDMARVAAAFAVYMLAVVLTFIRWHRLVRALGLPFLLRDALRLGFIGNVFNLVIPGAVGGDLIKAAFLCREQEHRTQAVASMVLDRIVGLLGLFLLAGIGGALAWPEAGREVRTLILAAWTFLAAGLVGLAVLFTPALYRPLRKLFADGGRLATMLDELIAMATAYRARLGTVAAMLLLATAIHALYVLAFFGMSRALFPSKAPSLAKHYLVVPLTLFTTAAPLPFGALGLTEKISETLFGLVHFPAGAVVMIGYRVLMYAGGLVSVIVYLANQAQVRRLRDEGSDLQEDPPAVHPEADQPEHDQDRRPPGHRAVGAG